MPCLGFSGILRVEIRIFAKDGDIKMTALRNQAMDIISELPEEHIAYVLAILENIQRISRPREIPHASAQFPLHLTKRENYDEIEQALNAISGAVPDTGMSLEEYRAERLAKYETIA